MSIITRVSLFSVPSLSRGVSNIRNNMSFGRVTCTLYPRSEALPDRSTDLKLPYGKRSKAMNKKHPRSAYRPTVDVIYESDNSTVYLRDSDLLT